MSQSRLALMLLCAVGSSVCLADEKPLYALTKTVAIGAPDRWDLLTYDAESHRVYIAHGDRVTVVDGQSGELIGSIEGYAGGTHGVAIVPGSGRGYTDEGRTGTADSFDLQTLKTPKTINADKDAHGTVLCTASTRLVVIEPDPGTI